MKSLFWFVQSCLLWQSSLGAEALISSDATVKTTTTTTTTSATTASPQQQASRKSVVVGVVGALRPSDLPEPAVFSNWQPTQNQTVLFENNNTVTYASGAVQQVGSQQADVTFSVLTSVVDRSDIQSIRSLLDQYDRNFFDDDPDTVDGMPTYEIFIDNPGLASKAEETIKYRDNPQNKEAYTARVELREQLQSILQPILETKITPFVRWRYPEKCQTSKHRYCTPCYSLIRRYKYGERVSHGTHHDGHAIVTVVVSLSDYNAEYRGGLYVVSPNSNATTLDDDRNKSSGTVQYLGLNMGDAAVHTSALLHGVKVHDKIKSKESTERWSWILWYKDSDTCEDHSVDWFKDCAYAGDAICQQLHATKVGTADEVLHWNMEAAKNGAGTAAVKIGRAYLHQLPSPLPYNATLAAKFFQKAIDAHNNPEGHYGMAQLLAEMLAKAEEKKTIKSKKWKDQRLAKVVYHLEAAAKAGHVFAIFNLGMAHTYGYGIPDNKIDADLAAEWFVASGLPEGYFVAAFQAGSVGNTQQQEEYLERAKVLGYGQPWRQQARLHTGSGGMGSVDLNLKWPTAHDGRKAPSF